MVINDKDGISKNNLLPILFVLIVGMSLVFIIAAGIEGMWLHPVNPIEFNEDVQNTYNISLNISLGAKVNVTQINITLPSAFNYLLGTNGTSLRVANFSNSSSSRVLTWMNATTSGDNLLNFSENNTLFWFNASVAAPGDYNITVSVVNVTNPAAITTMWFNVSVTINDTTKPTVFVSNLSNTTTNVATAVTGGNHSGTIVLNVSLSDNGRLQRVYFNITNGSGGFVQQNITYAFNYTASDWNATFDTTTLGDGVYNITVWANDSKNNINNSASYTDVHIDNFAPTGTLTCTPATVESGEAVACTCSATDAAGGAGVNTALTSYVAAPSTTDTGTHTASCSFADFAGHSGTASTTFSVTLTGSGTGSSGGGGGGGGTTTPTEIPTIDTKTSSFSEITPIAPVTMTGFTDETGVQEIQIEVSEATSNVKVTVATYESTPSSLSSSVGNAYQYLRVDTENLADKLSKATMKIKVEKSWVSSKGITPDDVALFRYNDNTDQWNELTTTYSNADTTYYYYTVELGSFSYFAIAPKVAVIEEEVPTEEQPSEGILGTQFLGLPVWAWIIIGVVLLVAIIGGGVVLTRKKKKR